MVATGDVRVGGIWDRAPALGGGDTGETAEEGKRVECVWRHSIGEEMGDVVEGDRVEGDSILAHGDDRGFDEYAVVRIEAAEGIFENGEVCSGSVGDNVVFEGEGDAAAVALGSSEGNYLDGSASAEGWWAIRGDRERGRDRASR